MILASCEYVAKRFSKHKVLCTRYFLESHIEAERLVLEYKAIEGQCKWLQMMCDAVVTQHHVLHFGPEVLQ